MWRSWRGRRLIVLPAGYACAREMPPQGPIANALHALTLLISRQVRSELESLDEAIDFHVAPPLCPLFGLPYDFSHTKELIERATKRTEQWLAEGGLERREIPHEMNAHKHV
jgi:NTE family protein